MAEIHIEKKKKPVWPWILGALLLLAGIIWLVVDTDSGNDNNQTATEQTYVQEEVYTDQQENLSSNAVEEFVTFVQDNNARQEMDLNHDYTAEGIRLLSAALNDVVDKLGTEDVNINQKKDYLNQKAQRIQQDPASTQHADTIRSAFITSAELMADIQSEHFPNLDDQVSNVKETAENIDPNTQTLNQKENVKAFFSSSAQALHDMNNKNEKASN